MHRVGSFAVALAFLLQTFAVASMPLMHLSADEDMVVICTGTGMKTVSLAQFLGTASDNEGEPAPDAAASTAPNRHAHHHEGRPGLPGLCI